MWYVYLLGSLLQRRTYVGITLDIARRLSEHNSGNTASTRPWKPWRVLHTEAYSTRSEALKRESYLKRPAGRKQREILCKAYQEEMENRTL